MVIIFDKDVTKELTIRDVLKELEKTRIQLISTMNKIRTGTDDDKLKFVDKCKCFVDVYTAVKPKNHKDFRVQKDAIECLNKAISLIKINNPELFS
jgi:uridine kinase